MKTYAELLAEEEAKDRAAPTTTERSATTATTPAEGKKERRAAELGKTRDYLTTDRAKAAGLAAARGLTVGLVDRAVGEGTQIGEDVYRMTHGQEVTPTREAEASARGEYLRKDAQARKDYPIMYPAVELGAGVIPAMAIPAGKAGQLGASLAERGTVRGLAAKAATSPEVMIPAQNAVAGAANQPSNEPRELFSNAAGGALAGKALGAVADKTIGKALRGSTGKEARGLVQDILRNEKTDISASATARKRFYEKADAAMQEVRADKPLEAAVRNGEAESAANMARSRLQVISEPRAGFYNELDSLQMLGIDQIDAAIRKAARTATGAKKTALETMQKKLETDWMPKWKEEGRLVTRDGKPLGVKGEGVREWLTESQNQADLVIGGLEEGPRKKVTDALEDVAHDVWQGHLNKVAKQAPELVQNIRTYDRRASGLLALETIMKQRQRKDYEGVLGFSKKAEATADKVLTTLAATGVAAGRPIESLLGIGSWYALKQAPNAARAINDKIIAPIQRAAMAGKPWAEVLAAASDQGVPQAMARTAYDSGLKLVESKRKGGSDRSASTEVR